MKKIKDSIKKMLGNEYVWYAIGGGLLLWNIIQGISNKKTAKEILKKLEKDFE